MNRWLILFGSFFAAHATGADIRSAPSLLYAPINAAPVAQLLLPSSITSRSIVLPEPTSDERARLKRANEIPAGAARGAPLPRPPLAIGFLRIPAQADRVIELGSLAWLPVERGAAAVITLTSPTAAAIRLQLRFIEQPRPAIRIEFRFAGSNGRQVFGPYEAEDFEASGLGWSPVLEGDTATVEVFVAGAHDGMGVIEIAQISHLVATPADRIGPTAKGVGQIGHAEACEVDVACNSSPTLAYLNQGTSSAQIVFTDGGSTFLCSGTLLNTTSSSGIPYFYTANHCVGNSAAAATLNAYWFFLASTCGSHAVPPYVVTAGGSTYLAGNVDFDFSFLRLNSPPPSGVYFSGWNANPMPTAVSASVFHYPAGDLEKYSVGMTGPYVHYPDGSSFIPVVYSSGSTEPGSSGSGLVTVNADGDYELRGGLFGGAADCSRPSGYDIYSRFDIAFPSLATYLVSAPCIYALSPLDLSNTAAAGASPSITVTSPAGCPVGATSFQPWVTINGITPSGGTTTVALQVSPNTGPARATAIVVTDRLFLITQVGP